MRRHTCPKYTIHKQCASMYLSILHLPGKTKKTPFLLEKNLNPDITFLRYPQIHLISISPLDIHILSICLLSSFSFQPLFPQCPHLNLHITPCFLILCILRYNSPPVYFPHILHPNSSSGNEQPLLLLKKKPLSFRGKNNSLP